MRIPPGLTTQFNPETIIDRRYDQDLIDFLLSSGEKTGYTNYWVSYPLAFETGEEIIFAPCLPYHKDLRYTERDDRYAPYRKHVDSQARAALITTSHPVLDEYIRKEMKDQGVSWEEKKIGDYQVFFRLSKKISPTDLGLGITTE
jgi:hypothetical protein